MDSVRESVMRVVVDTRLRGIPDLILLIREVGPNLARMMSVIVKLLTMIAGVASLIRAVANLVLNLSPVFNATVVLIQQFLASWVYTITTLASIEIVRSPLDTVVYSRGRGVGVHNTI